MLLRHEPPPVMPRLGPGIRIEQKRPRHRPLGQDIEHVSRITRINRNILRLCGPDFPQEHRHTVDERFTADNPGLGILHGLMHHMLTAAEPDFQPDLSIPE